MLERDLQVSHPLGLHAQASAKVEPQPPKCDPFANAKGCPKTP